MFLYVRSLAIQQCLKGVDKLQVGGRGDIVVSLQLQEEALRQVPGTGVELLAHLNTALQDVITHLYFLEEPLGYSLQGILRPRLPVTY